MLTLNGHWRKWCRPNISKHVDAPATAAYCLQTMANYILCVIRSAS